MKQEYIIAGFGGQGVLSIGLFLAYAGMAQGHKVLYVPSYGAEMRGGTAHCMVTISDREISAPVLSASETIVVMNQPSLDKFEPMVRTGGKLLINSTLVHREVKRTDIKSYLVPTAELAAEAGVPRGANMVMLGALLAVTGTVPENLIYDTLVKTFRGRYLERMPDNMRAIEKGMVYMQKKQGDDLLASCSTSVR